MRDINPREAGPLILTREERNLPSVTTRERFEDTFFVLYESYKGKRGRVLDPEQVQVLVETFEQLSEALNRAYELNLSLEAELEISE